VLAFRWTPRTERVLQRALELIPFFAEMDLYQDQSFLRHALFESFTTDGLVMRQASMDRFCRFGWYGRMSLSAMMANNGLPLPLPLPAGTVRGTIA
jgi:hypothetical protein